MDPKNLVIHTSAVKDASFEAVRNYHVNERGWDDIGYHYYIEKDGGIYSGRENHEVGAHCRASGMNHKSLGICFEGHHDHEDWTINQKASFTTLCANLMRRYGIPQKNIIGHREAYQEDPPPKTCPGNKIDMDLVRMKYGSDIEKVRLQPLEKLDDGKINFTKDIDKL